MYLGDQFASLGSSETRLKQFILKLKEQEKSNQELKNQVRLIKQEMEIQQKKLSREKAQKIKSSIDKMMHDINGLVQENIALKHS